MPGRREAADALNDKSSLPEPGFRRESIPGNDPRRRYPHPSWTGTGGTLKEIFRFNHDRRHIPAGRRKKPPRLQGAANRAPGLCRRRSGNAKPRLAQGSGPAPFRADEAPRPKPSKRRPAAPVGSGHRLLRSPKTRTASAIPVAGGHSLSAVPKGRKTAPCRFSPRAASSTFPGPCVPPFPPGLPRVPSFPAARPAFPGRASRLSRLPSSVFSAA